MSTYYDLEWILAESDRFQCVPIDLSVRLAHILQPPSHGTTVPNMPNTVPNIPNTGANTSELPFWMARALAEAGCVQFSALPRAFQPSTLQSLKTSPRHVPLAQLSPFFFHLALLVLDTFSNLTIDALGLSSATSTATTSSASSVNGSTHLKSLITTSLQDRLAKIFDLLLSVYVHQDPAKQPLLQAYIDTMDAYEKQVYVHALAAFVSCLTWLEASRLMTGAVNGTRIRMNLTSQMRFQ